MVRDMAVVVYSRTWWWWRGQGHGSGGVARDITVVLVYAKDTMVVMCAMKWWR